MSKCLYRRNLNEWTMTDNNCWRRRRKNRNSFPFLRIRVTIATVTMPMIFDINANKLATTSPLPILVIGLGKFASCPAGKQNEITHTHISNSIIISHRQRICSNFIH